MKWGFGDPSALTDFPQSLWDYKGAEVRTFGFSLCTQDPLLLRQETILTLNTLSFSFHVLQVEEKDLNLFMHTKRIICLRLWEQICWKPENFSLSHPGNAVFPQSSCFPPPLGVCVCWAWLPGAVKTHSMAHLMWIQQSTPISIYTSLFTLCQIVQSSLCYLRLDQLFCSRPLFFDLWNVLSACLIWVGVNALLDPISNFKKLFLHETKNLSQLCFIW